jgi:hypothetical protein
VLAQRETLRIRALRLSPDGDSGDVLARVAVARGAALARRGKPAAVLISETEFQRAHGQPRAGVGDAISAWRAKHGGVVLSDDEVASWRDRSIGRVPDLHGRKR